MKRLKMQAQRGSLGLTQVIGATLLGISIGSVSQANLAQAQVPQVIPIEVSPPNLNSPSLNSPSISPVRRFCPSDLVSAVDTIVENPKFRTAQWGILIEPIAEPTVLYQHNSRTSLIPASNVKLLTTAAAMRIFGETTPPTLPKFENWVTVINQESDNDLADALLNRIGGQRVVKATLASLGVDSNSYWQVDGSGLSRKNRATPATFVSLLKGMYTDNANELFYRSLSVAGVNGTLRNRFRNTLVQGRLHGKTGTLKGVKALSGYLENDNYGTISFSIVVNQPGQSAKVLTQAIDQIVLRMAQLERCD